MESEIEKNYEDIVEFCRQNNSLFVDHQFPPNDKSLGEAMVKKLNILYKSPNVIWLRPNQIVTSDEYENDEYEWSILNNPRPSDVVQCRNLANCSYVSAMAVIAERPDILDNIFPSKAISPEGVYRVRLYIYGEWKTIIVDDYFPCYVESNKMITATAKRKQLWVPLIEKAIAKTFGNYAMFAGGVSASFPLSMLTGANCISRLLPKNPDDFDLFWKTLKSLRSSNFLMCCGSYPQLQERVLYTKGIGDQHSYPIHDLNDDFENRLLLLKNPWGRKEWTGKWSKYWDGWPDLMKEELLIDRLDEDGVFWIEFDDFINNMSHVIICKPRPNWYEFREELTVGLDTTTIRITVTETCEASFATFSEKNVKSPSMVDMMVSVHRISQENLVGDMVGRSSRTSLCYDVSTKEVLLTPGQYIIILFDLSSLNRTNTPRAVVCYSSKPIYHELIHQTPQMFKQALREIILKDGKLKTNTEYGIYLRFLTNEFNGTIVMADNFLQAKYLHLSLDYSDSRSIYSSRDSLKTIDIIPPMSYQILTIISPTIVGMSWDWTLTKTWKVSREKFIGKNDTADQSIVCQKLQHFPIINPSDPVHLIQSIHVDSVPMKVSIRRKCSKRIKHLFKRCDCIELMN